TRASGSLSVSGDFGNSGDLQLGNGSSLMITGSLTNTGQVHVDDAFGASGSSLSISGTLTNSNLIVVGNTGMGGSTTVSANALSNSGTINITGNNTPATTDQ